MEFRFHFSEYEKWENFFHKNGFVVIHDILSEEQCDKLLLTYEKYATPDFGGIMNLDRGFIEGKNENGEVEFKRVHYKDSDFVKSVRFHPGIISVLEHLQSDVVDGLHTMFLFKRAGTKYGIEQAWNPHQDNDYPRAVRGAYITANIPLEDQNKENGCLFIYPGSHVEPLLSEHTVKSFHEGQGQRPGNPVDIPQEYKKVDVIMKKADALVLHSHVIHGSHPNLSKDKHRPMALFTYIKRGFQFIPGNDAKRMAEPVRPWPIKE